MVVGNVPKFSTSRLKNSKLCTFGPLDGRTLDRPKKRVALEHSLYQKSY